MKEIIIAAVLAFNVETGAQLVPEIFVAIAKVESELNAAALGKRGELGLMQIMPENWRRFGNGAWNDPVENVKAACRLWQAQKYKNDLFLALAEYNAGQEWVDKKLAESIHPDFGAVADYVYKILEAL